MTGSQPETISAEVVLRSRTGRSLSHPDVPVTAKTVHLFEPAPETVAAATEELRKLGFSVAAAGITLAIEGDLALFERVFGAGLLIERDEAGMARVRPKGPLKVPAPLQYLIEAVVFPEPPEFFGPASEKGG